MNKVLKEKMDQVSVEPSADVWTRINKTMRRRMVVRRVAGSVLGVAVVVVAVFAFWPLSADDSDRYVTVGNEHLVETGQSSAPKTDAIRTYSDVSESTEIIVASSNAENSGRDVVSDDEPYVENVETVSVGARSNVETSAFANSTDMDEGSSGEMTNTNVLFESTGIQLPVCEKLNDVECAEEVFGDGLLGDDKESMQAAGFEKGENGELVVEEMVLLVPNFFAPDGDVEENRVFRVSTVNNVTLNNFSMYIYDRRGQKVMQTKDMNESWDGTYQSRRMPQGAYVYIINYIDVNGVPKSKRGTVTLIR